MEHRLHLFVSHDQQMMCYIQHMNTISIFIFLILRAYLPDTVKNDTILYGACLYPNITVRAFF